MICLLANAAVLSSQEGRDPFAFGSQFFGKRILSIGYDADPPLNVSHFDPFMPVKPGQVLTRSGIKGAIQVLYNSGRFSRIAVKAADGEGGVHVRFELRYNYYFNSFVLEPNLSLGGRSLWEVIRLPIGERFTLEKLELARAAVLEYVHGQGFYLAKVEAETRPDNREWQVDTVFRVQPGPLATIKSIRVEGVPEQNVEEIRKVLGLEAGHSFDRRRLARRLDNLKSYFLKRGYLGAVAQVSDSFQSESNTVVLVLKVSDYGKTRVAVEGFKIDKDQLRRLLPILSGGGLTDELIEEGAQNIGDYLEERGYPQADVGIRNEEDRSGIRLVRYIVETGHRVTVSHVDFTGNRVISAAELLGAIQIQPAHFLQKSTYSITKLDDDVDSLKALYQARGYLDASVIPLIEPVKDGEKLGIRFEIEEGEQSHAGQVTLRNNQSIAAADLLGKLKLHPGGAYSPSIVEHDRQSIIAAYNDAGFLQPKVTYRTGAPDAGGAIPVEFDIEEGTRTLVDDIIVLGNRVTREGVIDRHIALARAGPLSLGKLLKTQQSLYNTGVFDLVRVTPQTPESVYPYQNVVIRLEEARRFTVRYGIGYQEREHLRGTLELSHLNIFGTARRADLRLRGSTIEQGAALSFQQPQFRFLPVDSYFTVSGLRRRDVSFDQRRLNLSYQYGHPVSSHAWGLLRYTFNNVRLSNLKVSPSELGREDTPRNLSTFSAIYINDTRDSYLDPEKGFFTSTDFSVTTRLVGSNDYLSLFTQNSYFRKLPGLLRMAGSLRIGLAAPFGGDASIPISERFFAGGGSSLRGFDTDFAGPLDPATNQPVGGNALVIGNLEIRVPVLRAVHLAGFYDTGNVFRSVSDIEIGGFSHTVGIGIRLKTPFGPLRADFGHNVNLPGDLRARGLTPNHFFITIGPPF